LQLRNLDLLLEYLGVVRWIRRKKTQERCGGAELHHELSIHAPCSTCRPVLFPTFWILGKRTSLNSKRNESIHSDFLFFFVSNCHIIGIVATVRAVNKNTTACDVTTPAACLCGWLIGDVVCEPYDFDNGARGEQYESGSDDSGAPPSSDFFESKDDKRVAGGGSCDYHDDEPTSVSNCCRTRRVPVI